MTESPLHWAALSGGLLVAGLASAWLTESLRRYAVRRGIQDIPNERSSHARPTPRGGGLAIVIVTTIGACTLGLVREWSHVHTALIAGGAALAVIGWIDDVRGAPVVVRLSVHLAAAVATVLLMGPLHLDFGGLLTLDGGWAIALGAFWIAWMINSYNFMDGIDGIAAGQCSSVAAVLGALAWHGGAVPLAEMTMLLSASSLGFLARNWHPARIFMGDVASGWIGYELAVIGLAAGGVGAVPLPAFLILMGVFLVDSTWTLLRRLAAGEKVYKAHRDHAYQHAVQRGHSHARVAGAVILINLLWLAPLAVVAASRPSWGPALLVIAWTPLLGLAIHYQAGPLRR